MSDWNTDSNEKRLVSSKIVKEVFKIRNDDNFTKKLLESKAAIENRFKVAFDIIPEKTPTSCWCSVKLEAYNPNDLKAAKQFITGLRNSSGEMETRRLQGLSQAALTTVEGARKCFKMQKVDIYIHHDKKEVTVTGSAADVQNAYDLLVLLTKSPDRSGSSLTDPSSRDRPCDVTTTLPARGNTCHRVEIVALGTPVHRETKMETRNRPKPRTLGIPPPGLDDELDEVFSTENPDYADYLEPEPTTHVITASRPAYPLTHKSSNHTAATYKPSNHTAATHRPSHTTTNLQNNLNAPAGDTAVVANDVITNDASLIAESLDVEDIPNDRDDCVEYCLVENPEPLNDLSKLKINHPAEGSYSQTVGHTKQHVDALLQATCVTSQPQPSILSRDSHSEPIITSRDLSDQSERILSPESTSLSDLPGSRRIHNSYSEYLEYVLKLGFSQHDLDVALRELPKGVGLNELLRHFSDQPRSASFTSDWSTDSSDVADDVRLRPIVIDGSNVAMRHGRDKTYSCRGIVIAVDYFRNRGHSQINVLVPASRKQAANRLEPPTQDGHLLTELEASHVLSFTPMSRQADGRPRVHYDDLFILRHAARSGGVVVSTDNYRDLMNEADEIVDVIKNRLLPFMFIEDDFYPVEDPLGRHGPRLAKFLSFDPHIAHQPPNCPYGVRCTYGPKCKFFHPERTNKRSVSLSDDPKRNRKARKAKEYSRLKQHLLRHSSETDGKSRHTAESEGKNSDLPRPVGEVRPQHINDDSIPPPLPPRTRKLPAPVGLPPLPSPAGLPPVPSPVAVPSPATVPSPAGPPPLLPSALAVTHRPVSPHPTSPHQPVYPANSLYPYYQVLSPQTPYPQYVVPPYYPPYAFVLPTNYEPTYIQPNVYQHDACKCNVFSDRYSSRSLEPLPSSESCHSCSSCGRAVRLDEKPTSI